MYTVKKSPRVNGEQLVDKKFICWVLLTMSCLYLQFIPVLNYLFLAFIVLFILFCFYKKWPSGLIPLFVLSFLHGDGSVSLYTAKIYGVSLFYILILVLLSLKLVVRKRVGKKELIVWFTFGVYFLLSILNGGYEKSDYFLNDTLFFLIFVSFLFSISDFKQFNIEKMFIAMSLGYFLTKIIVCLTGVGLQIASYSSTVEQYSAVYDPIENLFLIFNLLVIFCSRDRNVRALSFLNIVLFGLSAFLLGYVHGATIVLVLLVIIYGLLRNLKFLLVVIPLLAMLLLAFTFDPSLFFERQGESIFLYKINKVLGLFEFLYDPNMSIYELPRSTQVRLIESANLLGQNPFYLIFGNGFGGGVTETVYSYGEYLNSDDYSIDQIESGEYQELHAYNQIVLKHGLLSLLIALALFWKFRAVEHRNFRDTALIFLVLSYSFTIKPYLILGLLVFSLRGRRSGNV